jgi:[acyl-carrier-protein] S-malonyltransferase
MANINCPGQVVISGSKTKIEKAAEIANNNGAKRVIPLEVSGAFHSPLMGSAVEGLAEVINSLDFNSPKIPIVANTTAEIMTTAEEVVEELLRQLCTGVLWQSSIEFMQNNGINSYIEIGPGKVLAGLIRRIYRDARILSVGSALEVSSFSC